MLLPVLFTFAAAASGPPTAPPFDASVLPPSAVARAPGTDEQRHPVEARLVVERASVAPGERVRVGVHLVQDPQWHTYWKTPGDIGLPTNVRWTLPDGVSVEPIRQPIPERFEADGMISYGYDHEVLHSAWLTVPPDASGNLKLTADVDWLVCKTSCIPGAVHLELPVTVSASAEGPARPLFDHYEARLPVNEHPALMVTAELDQAPLVANGTFRAAFHVRAAEGHTMGAIAATPTWPTFLPVGGRDWMPTGSQIVPQADGSVIFLVNGMGFEPEAPATDTVGALLQITLDGAPVAVELSRELPWGPPDAPRVASQSPLWASLDAAAPAAPSGPVADAAPDLDAPVLAPTPVGADAPPLTAALLAFNLLMAFVGGLILNVMPCVLPVLTLKLYSLVEQGDTGAEERRKAGLGYTAGILVSFWALALAVWVLRGVFSLDVGWGFQFQYPEYVAGLATVVYLFGLSLFGVFELPAVGADKADELGGKEGMAGYFFTGVFATLVATPCSAPFLGTAIAFAFQAPTGLLFAVFTAIGLGLAAPFLAVAYIPALWRFLPRPGAWMEAFKHLLGFSLVATTLWLVDVLAAQIGADRAVGFLGFLLTVSIGAWIFGRWGDVAASGAERLRAFAGAVAVGSLGAWGLLDLTMAEAEVCDDGKEVNTQLAFDASIPWQAFHPERLAALSGKTVFIDFTADWCVSCKVNEHTVLESESVRGAMARLGVVPLKADWTRKDALIADWLQRYGRAGVPMYLVVPPAGVDGAVLLPEVITPDMVIGALEAASG